MKGKFIAAAIAGAALIAPSGASALQPTVRTAAQRIDGTDQFVWTCVGYALPPITSFTLNCNGQRAVGTFPVATISGVGTGAPRVCWNGVFQYGTGFPAPYAFFDDCREGEHLPV
jgi:hypothetical protein